MAECQATFFYKGMQIDCDLQYGHKGDHAATLNKKEDKHGIVFSYAIAVRWMMRAK